MFRREEVEELPFLSCQTTTFWAFGHPTGEGVRASVRPVLVLTRDTGYSSATMWTWWFIARDDEAPQMPGEEEGDRPVLSFEADESEIGALGAAIGAKYEPVPIFDIDAHRSIVRVPDAFVRKLAEVREPASAVRMWQAKSASIRAREAASLAATLTEMRDFAAEAANGPGIVAYRDA